MPFLSFKKTSARLYAFYLFPLLCFGAAYFGISPEVIIASLTYMGGMHIFGTPRNPEDGQ